MVSFQTKNPNLGKFWRALDWKMLIYFMAIWNIIHTFGIFCNHFVHFLFTLYINFGFGILYQETSGNPDLKPSRIQPTFVNAD
jgi:preprotein translocase subunit SecY